MLTKTLKKKKIRPSFFKKRSSGTVVFYVVFIGIQKIPPHLYALSLKSGRYNFIYSKSYGRSDKAQSSG